jgi:hypothetical protein
MMHAAAAAVPADPESVTYCLLDVFSTIQSHRDPRGTIYPVCAVLALVLIALLSGCKNPSQIYAFGQAQPQLLPKLGFRPRRRPRRAERKGLITAPNEDTIGNILKSISPGELNEKFTLFLGRMVARGAVAAVDGKALRGSQDHVLSVFVNEIGQVVWQEDVGAKENELRTLERALPRILEKYPQLKLLSGDAGFCHKSIARQLVKARRDYLLQLKAPHGTDLALARDSFAQLTAATPSLARSEDKRGAPRGRSG